VTEQDAGGRVTSDGGHDQRLLALVGCIHGLALEFDEAGRYLDVWGDDPALLAVPREMAIGKTISEVLGPEVGNGFTQLVMRVFASGQTEHVEYAMTTGQDGALRWFLADFKRVRAGSRTTVVGFVRDISERKHAEEALRRSEERFRLAERATNDLLRDWTIATGGVTWGPSVCDVFQERTAGSSIEWWFEHIHPEDLPRVRESLGQSLAGDDASWSSAYRLRRGDGTFADVLDRGFIVRKDGRPVRMVGSMTDVTPLNRLQAQLVQADRLAAIGLLAAGVGHEINNPLAYVLGNLEFALNAGPFAVHPDAAEREEEARAALREAQVGAGRIADIVRSLKLFSRSEPVAVTAVSVEDVLERSIRMADNEIRHRARLVRRYAPVPTVMVSEARLGQVFLNLLINASQAITDGNHARHEISVATGVDARGRVFVSFSDTGQGIPPEHVDRVFDPFFTTKPSVGTGIGLSVCHGIVQSMRGELTVTSGPIEVRPGEMADRTVFTVSLPAAAPVVVEVPLAPASTPLPGRSRVLVIDDEAAVARYIARVLRKDCDVTTETSSRAALARLAAGEPYDVVLCDVMMPDMNGIELYEVVRKRHPELVPRVFFMTGGAFTPEAAQFLDSLPNPPLEKPMGSEKLRSILRAAGAVAA